VTINSVEVLYSVGTVVDDVIIMLMSIFDRAVFFKSNNIYEIVI